MNQSRQGQACARQELDQPLGDHRGVALPLGLTPETADKVEGMIVRYMDEPDTFPFEFGVRLFEVFRGMPQSS